MDYYFYKFIHVAAAIIFLGNIITGIFWMRIAVKTKNLTIITHSMKGIITADTYFTNPSVIVLAASGIMTAVIGQFPMLSTGWILWPIILFILSGAVYGVTLSPLQKRIHAFAVNGLEQESFDWTAFNKLYRSWEIWGAVATLLPVIASVMMVMKIPK